MRWDIRVTIYTWFAGAALAVCLMAAAIRLHFDGVFGAFCLWGGLALFVILAMAAIREALLGEKLLSASGHGKRVVSLYGMIFSGSAFLLFMLFYLMSLHQGSVTATSLPRQASSPLQTQVNTVPTEEKPKIGSLRLTESILRVDLSSSTGSVSAQVQLRLVNDSDAVVSFHATTAGNINDKWFDKNKVEFNGYAYPHQDFYLLSAKLPDLRPSAKDPQNFMKLTAVFEYTLLYKFAAEKEFSRKSSRGVKIEQEITLKAGEPGTSKTIPLVVWLYDEKEE